MSLRQIARLVVASVLIGGGAQAEVARQPLDWTALNLTDIHGKPLPSESLTGKVVLAVNTASECGFTPQYQGLEALWQSYRDQGLVVLAVPSNDFGGQEPGDNAEIAAFCERRFQVSFPMLEKAPVKGPAAQPIFAWASRITGGKATPLWNFHKLLIGRDGQLLGWYTSFTKPQAKSVTDAIEAALEERVSSATGGR